MVSYKNVKNALATLTFWGPVLTKDSQSLHFSSGLPGGERVIQNWSFMMGVEGLKSSTDHFGTVGIAQCPPCMGWGQSLGQRPEHCYVGRAFEMEFPLQGLLGPSLPNPHPHCCSGVF